MTFSQHCFSCLHNLTCSLLINHNGNINALTQHRNTARNTLVTIDNNRQCNAPHRHRKNTSSRLKCLAITPPARHRQTFDTSTNAAVINSPAQLTQLFKSDRHLPRTSKPFCAIYYLALGWECNVEKIKYACNVSTHLRLLDPTTTGLEVWALRGVSCWIKVKIKTRKGRIAST